jgi:hypothetical protein
MTRLTGNIALVAVAAALIFAMPGAAFAAKKKATMKPACSPGALCTAPCNDAKLCSIHVCRSGGGTIPTLGFCREGSPFCPPKC